MVRWPSLPRIATAGTRDARRVPRRVRRRRSASSPTIATPSARRAARVPGGSRVPRSSPIIRRMNRSAASAGSSPLVAAPAPPAVVPGHQSSHDSGVS